MIALFTVIFTTSLLMQPDSLPSQESTPVVIMVQIEGAIAPPVTNHIKRGLEEARQAGAELFLITLDTPGGLLKSTKNIVQLFLDSKDLPIAVYVSPEGASAASAGTFITMAAHIAAMAPATNIGAASPVQMAPGGSSGQTDSVMQKKIFNYSESYIESIANRRGRNAEWAISAVRDGESITSQKALELNVIDFIAANMQELLEKTDGMILDEDTVQTSGAKIREVPASLAENLLSFLIRPEVMLILTMIAIYGIIGEVTNPGAIVPGMAGAIALILVLYASASIPINIAGFVLIGLAILLFIAEAFTPTFGLLIAGGAVSFFLGSMMLFQNLPESMSLSWKWLLPATLLTALFFIWIVTEGIRIQYNRHRTGKEAMVGETAEVIEPVDKSGGRVYCKGEYWYAVSSEPITKHETCIIEQVDGMKLKVKKQKS